VAAAPPEVAAVRPWLELEAARLAAAAARLWLEQEVARLAVAVRLWLALEAARLAATAAARPWLELETARPAAAAPWQQASSAASASPGTRPGQWRQFQPVAAPLAPARPAAAIHQPAAAAAGFEIPLVRHRRHSRWRMASKPSRRRSPKAT
jgi:hypothetical protein